jgi:hypothetical protein
MSHAEAKPQGKLQPSMQEDVSCTARAEAQHLQRRCRNKI